MIKQIAIAASLALLSTAAMAADEPFYYAGADVGQTKLDVDATFEALFPTFDDTDVSVGGFVGYQFNQNIAMELGYRSLADFKFAGADWRARQTALSVIGSIPFGSGFSVFGRLGYNHVSLKVKSAGGTDTESESKVMYGVGMAFQITPVIAARVEAQRPSSDVTNVSAGVSFRF